MFTTSVYSLVVTAHVSAATLLIAASMLALHARNAIVRAQSLPTLRLWLEFTRQSTKATPAAAFAVLATGTYLGSYGWWAEPWFYVAAAMWAVNSALAIRVIKPRAAALMAVASQTVGTGITPELDAIRRCTPWPVAAATMRASDFAMLYVMFTKPSLAESCLVVLAAASFFVIADLARDRRHQVNPGHSPDAQMAEA